MESSVGLEISPVMSSESMEAFRKGIFDLLSQWPALQLAVRREWGGRDSRRKCDEFVSSLLMWFSKSGPIYVDDIEHILDESLVLLFNVEVEDGSVEQIAEKLLILHEDCLHDNL